MKKISETNLVSELNPEFFVEMAGLLKRLHEEHIDKLEIKIQQYVFETTLIPTKYVLEFYSNEKCIGTYVLSRVGKTLVHYLNNREIMSQQIKTI
ncbi:MAG: hypothetical protein AABX49_02680 [Nanoarchaeota archaeon]